MKYTVILTQDQQGNILATAPDLPDCHVQAKTRHEALRSLRNSIADLISQSEIIQLDVPVEPKTGTLREKPWEMFGAFQDDPTWGVLFDDHKS